MEMMVNDVKSSEEEALRSELVGLFQYIQRVRQEIAAIHKPAEDEHKFGSMGDQLDAIVEATDQASNAIMAQTEANEDLLQRLRGSLKEGPKTKLIDQVSANNMQIIEACSFQDITGQRVSKVARSITYVEDRVNALIEAWGKSALETVEVEPDHIKSEDEKLLNGPQLEGKGLDQSEIDALFD